MTNSSVFVQRIQALLSTESCTADTFLLKYISTQGRVLSPGVFENQTELQLTGDGHLQIFRRKNSGEQVEPAPGHFTGSITKAEIDKLLSALLGSEDWPAIESLPSPLDTHHRLHLNIGGEITVVTWGSLSPNDFLVRQELLNPLFNMLTHSSLKARWAIYLKIKAVNPINNGLAIVAELSNQGNSDILVVNPHADQSHAVITAAYGSKPIVEPGITPLPIEIFHSEGLLKTPGKTIQNLPPGDTLTFNVAFDIPPETPNFLLKITYRQHALSDSFFGKPLFQGEAYSAEWSA